MAIKMRVLYASGKAIIAAMAALIQSEYGLAINAVDKIPPAYSCDKERLVILMLSLKGTNLWTWTKYRGFDPEMSSSVGTSNSTLGIDRSSYPASKSFTFNVNITF